MKVRVFTAFSGYDSQCMALDRIKAEHPDFDYELVGWSEIDRFAIKSHDALYPDAVDRNFGDISKIDWQSVPDFDFFTYSFPCTDISNAGRQMGFAEGSGTRSSLLWECRKAIIAKKPKWLLMENVKALIQGDSIPHFRRWIEELDSYGYRSFWQCCNAADYGVPQHRERVFMVSIRIDADDTHPTYSFPQPIELQKCLADVLEQDVADEFYLSDERVRGLIKSTDKEKLAGNGFKFVPKLPEDIASALQTIGGGERQITTYAKE